MNLRLGVWVAVLVLGGAPLIAQEMEAYDDEKTAPESFTSRWVYAKLGLNVRAQGDLKGAVLALLPFGTKVEVLEKRKPEVVINETRGYWMRIRSSLGDGWCFSGFLRPFDPYAVVVRKEGLVGTWIQPGGAASSFGPTGISIHRKSVISLQLG